MAKQKSIAPVRVRSSENAIAEVRARALKLGSISVTTRPVGPDKVESVIEFKKGSQVKDFQAWLHKKRDMELISED